MPKEALPAPRLMQAAGLFIWGWPQGESIMHYLGGISGGGVVICGGKEIARASYDFDGYLRPPTGVVSCGEIRLSPSKLQGLLGRNDVQIRTDDGRLLDLRFSDKKLDAGTDAAHVDVTGELPPAFPQNWRR
jgi:hypothetical protein